MTGWVPSFRTHRQYDLLKVVIPVVEKSVNVGLLLTLRFLFALIVFLIKTIPFAHRNDGMGSSFRTHQQYNLLKVVIRVVEKSVDWELCFWIRHFEHISSIIFLRLDFTLWRNLLMSGSAFNSEISLRLNSISN